MAELLLVNPHARRRRTRRTHLRRNPRRHRKMSAKQAMYFGKRRHRRRARHVTALASNPIRRHRRHRIRRTHLRRNPVRLGRMNINSFLRDTLMPAGVGAAGALGLDLALGYLGPHLPAVLTTGTIMPTVTRIGGAVGLGFLAHTITGDRRMGEQIAAGAIVVTLYGMAKSWLQTNAPSLPLSGVGMYVGGMGYPGAAMHYPDRRVGMYVPGGQQVLPPATSAAIARAAANLNRPPVGVHGAYSEGEYQYGR